MGILCMEILLLLMNILDSITAIMINICLIIILSSNRFCCSILIRYYKLQIDIWKEENRREIEEIKET